LANCGIIELREQGKESKPIILYDQIVLDFPISKDRVLGEKAVNRPAVQT
jgi:predicted transcriptional regulator